MEKCPDFGGRENKANLRVWPTPKVVERDRAGSSGPGLLLADAIQVLDAS
jgi:hypothetical protein